METFFAFGDLKPQGANRCLTSKTGEFYLKQVTESLKLKKRLKHSKLVYLILGLTFCFGEIIGRTQKSVFSRKASWTDGGWEYCRWTL